MTDRTRNNGEFEQIECTVLAWININGIPTYSIAYRDIFLRIQLDKVVEMLRKFDELDENNTSTVQSLKQWQTKKETGNGLRQNPFDL